MRCAKAESRRRQRGKRLGVPNERRGTRSALRGGPAFNDISARYYGLLGLIPWDRDGGHRETEGIR